MKYSGEYKPKSMSNGVLVLGIIIIVIIIAYGLFIRYYSFNKEDDDEFIVSYTIENNNVYDSLGNVVFVNERNLPVITSSNNQEIADNIVDSLTNISDDMWYYINNISSESSISYFISTGIITDGRLTFRFTLDGSNISFISYYNYSSSTGNMLSLYDISDDDEFISILYDNIILNIENSEYISMFSDDSWMEVVSDLMVVDGNWYFTSFGISFILDLGLDDYVNVDIDKSYINEYIYDEYKI